MTEPFPKLQVVEVERCGATMLAPPPMFPDMEHDRLVVCDLAPGHEGMHAGTFFADRCDWKVRWRDKEEGA